MVHVNFLSYKLIKGIFPEIDWNLINVQSELK